MHWSFLKKIKKIKFRLSLVIIIVAGILIAWVGLWIANWRGERVDTKIRNEILVQTVDIAQSIDPLLVKALRFDSSDLTLPEYQLIRDQMIAYGQIIKQRGIYSMALKNNTIVFGPENYPAGDPMGTGYPGTVYEEPGQPDFDIFITKRPIVTGPATDEYGSFISGSAPVLDPLTGEVLMVVGIDILSEDWEQAIRDARKFPVIGTMLILILIGVGYSLIHFRNKLPETIQQRYRHIETYLVAISGVFLITGITLVVREYEENEKQNLIQLKSKSHSDDIKNEFSEIKTNVSMLGNFFTNSQFVDNQEFKAFTSLMISYSSPVSYLWVPDIADPENFRHHLIQYAEPLKSERFIPGFNLNSVPSYTKAMMFSTLTGLITCADPEPMIFDHREQSIALSFQWICKTDCTSRNHSAATEVRQNSGFIVAVMGLQSILRSSLLSYNVNEPLMHFDLVDLMNKDGPMIVATYPNDPENIIKCSFDQQYLKQLRYAAVNPLFMFGRAFAICGHSTDNSYLEVSLNTWWIVALVLLVLTIFLTLFVRYLQNRHVSMERMIRQRTSELETAKEKAEESDRLKSTFLANMSHEIRTPMNAIMGFASLISEPDVTFEDRKKFSGIIHSRSNDLLHLVNDILEISRIESGNATVIKSKINLNNLLDEIKIVSLQKLDRMDKKELNLILEKTLSDDQIIIDTDAHIVKQVYSNLIDNAIKFTPRGSIHFGYFPPENGILTCYVKDTGIGIEKEGQAIIFEHFRQADIKNPHQYGGTGLGLSICKGSLELLGGTIRVESNPGAGSIFYFTLPYLPEENPVTVSDSPSTDKKETEIPDWNGKKIVLVEDDDWNMEYLMTILQRTKAELICISSGKSLRNIYPTLGEADLVLLDILLPDANGWELAKEIKSRYPKLPIIAQTALAMSTDWEKSFDAGCDNYITKPISRKNLLQMMKKYLDH